MSLFLRISAWFFLIAGGVTVGICIGRAGLLWIAAFGLVYIGFVCLTKLEDLEGGAHGLWRNKLGADSEVLNMITLTQLKSFCSTDETRHVLLEPSSQDGYAWATDGTILVRVPLMPEVPEVEKFPKLETVWAAFNPAGDFKPLPPLPEPITETPVTCDECGGSGLTKCRACLQDMDCGDCDGTGKVIPPDMRWTRVEGHPFMIGLLQRIAALPNPRLAVAGDVKDGDVTGALGSFVFDGGEGIVRGLKARDEWTDRNREDANEWKPEPEQQEASA